MAYAFVFCYRTFYRSVEQALWALLFAFVCAPVASLPGLARLLQGHGLFGQTAGARIHLMSDGFFHGLSTCAMLTFGSAPQALSIALLARCCGTNDRRWIYWLTTVCLLSPLNHPFEIFVTVTVTALVLLTCEQSLRQN